MPATPTVVSFSIKLTGLRSLPLAARGSHRNGDVAAQGPGLPATAEADLQPDYGSQQTPT